MKYIERLENRDEAKAFNFLTGVTRDDKGRIKEATKVTLWGHNVKAAIKRFNQMTAGADFILLKA